MQDLSVALFQNDIVWENADANRAFLDSAFSSFLEKGEHADVVLLPEMFTTGFTMNPSSLAETMEGPSVLWMKTWAQQLNTLLCGSLVIEDQGHYFNRLVAVYPDGAVHTYDKRHLFTLAGEDQSYSPGNQHLILEYKEFKLQFFICFDLRFPVWCRNTEDVDVQIFVANWPDVRLRAWSTLLMARAIENQCYVLGLNRFGVDGNGFMHSGASVVLDPLGEILAYVDQKAGVLRAEISRDHIRKIRRTLPFAKSADSFKLI